MDLGFFGDDGCFHIHGVTGPDEYTAMVDDNAYTNLMARLNLRYAAAVVRRLRAEQPEDFAGLQAELTLDQSELGRLGSTPPSRCTSRTTPAAGSRPGRHVPHARALGSVGRAGGRSSRCSCTTIRSPCTGAKCSSRPTW